MERFDTDKSGGSLQISSDVVEKIARHAALEVDGVEAIQGNTSNNGNFIEKITAPRSISVELVEDVAEIEVAVVVRYGVKVPEVCEMVQKNVKSAVQNMTSITVGRVDIAVTGVKPEEESES